MTFFTVILLLAAYISASAKVPGSYAFSTGHAFNAANADKRAVWRQKRANPVVDLAAYAEKRAVWRQKRANHVVDLAAYAVKRAVWRQKRANPVVDLAAYAAKRAVEKLLTGTIQTGDGNLLRTYIKYAKDKQYIKDFDSLRPTNINERKWDNGVIDKTGMVGDKFVLATKYGPNGIPILEIQSYTKVNQILTPTIDRITYIE